MLAAQSESAYNELIVSAIDYSLARPQIVEAFFFQDGHDEGEWRARLGHARFVHDHPGLATRVPLLRYTGSSWPAREPSTSAFENMAAP
jgi:hypothetical protein